MLSHSPRCAYPSRDLLLICALFRRLSYTQSRPSGWSLSISISCSHTLSRGRLDKCYPLISLGRAYLLASHELCHLVTALSHARTLLTCHLLSQVASAPLGTQAASLDIDSAFRNIPILPAHKAFIVVQCEEGVFYIDHVCPFGITSGPGVQGVAMDAVVDILAAKKVEPSKKWVDDLFNLRFPTGGGPSPSSFVYAFSILDIFRITAPLGVPWKLGKYHEHAYVATYLGFLWDLWNRTVSLPEAKRLKYLAKLSVFTTLASSGRVTLSDSMSINGTLSHVSFVYPNGRAFLTNLSCFISKFDNKFAPRFPPHSMISDLKWWLSALSISGVTRSLTSRGPTKDLGIWVDASTDWGIGVIIKGFWNAWTWLPDWKGDGRDIGWAEMVAVELVARYVEKLGYSNAEILIRSDNMGVVGAYNRGRSRNFPTNEAIRRTDVLAMSLNIKFSLQYVNTKVNLADPVSRGVPVPGLKHLPSPFPLPGELSPYLVDVI